MKDHFIHKEVLMNIPLTWKLVIGAILLAMMVGCASGPPRKLVQRNDHASLATWYQKKARDLHAHAEEMHQIEQEYEFIETPKIGHESILVQHAKNLEDYYTKAAESAEALAKFHGEQVKNP